MRSVGALGALALFVVAGLWTARAGEAGSLWNDLAASVAVAWGVAFVAWAFARRLTADPARAFLIAVLALGWLALGGTFGLFVTRLFSPIPVDGSSIAITWTLVLGLLAVGIVKASGPAARFADAIEVGAALLAVLTIGRLGASALATQRDAGASAEAAEAWEDARQPARPDIYLVVLDMRASVGWMASEYGYDQSRFLDSLRALGFSIPTAAYANYTHTQLALPSLLNGRLLEDDSTTATVEGSAVYDLVGESSLWPTVHERGYRIAFFPTPYPATRELPESDLDLPAPSTRRIPWAETLVAHSPFALSPELRCHVFECEESILAPFPFESASALEWKFKMLATLPDSAGPVFAFLHVLSPHEPYLYADDCSHRTPWWPLDEVDSDEQDALRRAYGAQARCVDSLTLGAVSEILRRSEIPPVIVITSDHGHGRIGRDVLRGITFELDELPPARLAERLRVFTAVHLPRGAAAIPDTISLVELMPLVRRAAWGDTVNVHREAPSYWSPFHRMHDFVPVPRSQLDEPPLTDRP